MFSEVRKDRINRVIAESDRILNLEDESKMITDFASEEESLITYDTLKSLKELKWYYVNKGVRFMPIDLNNEVLEFRCIIDNRLIKQVKKKWRFGKQLHDCWEMCIPKKGTIISNNKHASVGKYLIFKPFEIHNPSGELDEETDIIVKFSKQPFNI